MADPAAWTPPASDAVWTPPDSDAVSDDPKPLTVGSTLKGIGDVALTGALNILPAAANSAIDLGSRLTGNGPNTDTLPQAHLGESGSNLVQTILKPRTANGLDVSDEELRGVLDPSGTMPIEKLRAAYKLEGAKSTAQMLKDSGTVAGDVVGNAIDVGSDVANIVPAAGLVKNAVTAGVRGAVVGGAENQAATQARLADAAASGTTLTAGQASGSKLLQKIEGASSKVWGGGPITSVADSQTENLGGHIDNVVKNLANGGDVSPTGAGTAINEGAATAKTNMRAAEKAAYDRVDQLVPADHPVDVSGALSKLEDLTKPTAGAETSAGALVSPKLTAMRDNLKADIAANGADPLLTGAAPKTVLPYSAVTALRTKLGNSIDWGFAPADPVANGALKQVHGALKGDLDSAASAISPEAKQAVLDARSLYTQNEERRDLLNRVIDKAGGPEAVYRAATSGTREGATTVGGVMSALDPGQQNLVRATVINRLGKALPGMQNSEGDAFNPSTFLTNWNKLDEKAKNALFGGKGATNQLRRGLDSFADTTSTIRNSTLYKNPSGTAAAAGHGYGLLALLGEAGAALAGHPKAIAVTGGAIAANNVLARALTNPRTVRWLASSAKLQTHALPNAVNQLARMGKVDPDAGDLAAYLQQQQQQQDGAQ